MDTIQNPFADGRRRRRRHSAEFKADVVAACCQAGASIASVALANGINANLARRWVLDAEAPVDGTPRRLPAPTKKALADVAPATMNFVPLQLPSPSASSSVDIRIEVTRGPTKILVTWPASAAADCATMLRDLLR